MNAGHPRPTCLAAAGIQCTPVLAINELTQEAMEFAFEYRPPRERPGGVGLDAKSVTY
jgi:hypothetical protein